jgi:hypothetical protein
VSGDQLVGFPIPDGLVPVLMGVGRKWEQMGQLHEYEHLGIFAPVADQRIHYAPESDDVGVCGLPGYLVESREHVTCAWCIDAMRAENIRRGLTAGGDEVPSQETR